MTILSFIVTFDQFHESFQKKIYIFWGRFLHFSKMGVGKVHKAGYDLGTPKAHLMCQRAAHKAISIDKYELF